MGWINPPRALRLPLSNLPRLTSAAFGQSVADDHIINTSEWKINQFLRKQKCFFPISLTDD